ncbi:MAG: histidine--tRNA ligase [Caldimicrobium sp.]
MKVQAVRGFKDWLPEDFVKFQYLIETARTYLHKANFKEIKIPILEKTELFVRSIGEVTDIVQKETYTFQDRNQEYLTLRPEATAGVCRLVIEHGLYIRPKPLKLFTIGPMFRHERPQKGRLREFYQIDVEFLGPLTPYYEVELLELALSILEEPLKHFQKSDEKIFTLEINSLGCPKCRPTYKAYLKEELEKKAEKFCKTCQERITRNPLRVLDCKNENCKEELRGLKFISQFLCEECQIHFQRLRELLEKREIDYRVNPYLVRGLDYYVRTIFEIKAKGLGAQDTVCAGGRYDYLVKELGGPELPAIGFAIGLERWALSLFGEEEIPPFLAEELKPIAVFIPLGDKAKEEGLSIVSSLRKKGFKIEAFFEDKSLKAMLREADKLLAKYALILGEDELKEEKILVKNLQVGKQEKVDIKVLADYLKGMESGNLP